MKGHLMCHESHTGERGSSQEKIQGQGDWKRRSKVEVCVREMISLSAFGAAPGGEPLAHRRTIIIDQSLCLASTRGIASCDFSRLDR